MARVVCHVEFAPDRIGFRWGDGPDTFPPYALTGQAADLFREKVTAVRDRLRDLVGIYLDSLADPAAGAADQEPLRRASLALAEAGHQLRERAFRPTEDPGKAARDVARWLEQLHAMGAVECLEVVADGGPPVPWNLLYDARPDPAAFLAGADETWRGFWGLRYNLAGGQRVDPRRRVPLPHTPRVVLVVDPLVRAGLPHEQRDRLDHFAAARGLTLVGSRSELEATLAGGRPDVLYWLGHATPDALVLGDGPGSEVRPGDLMELLEGDGDAPPGGLVFLNACRTAEESPTAGSFFRAVFGLRMGGLIATEQQTVDTFAAPLGLDFLEAFLDRGESVGAAMHKLRGRVPLGLLYGTYCPPELRVASTAAGGPPAASIDTAVPAPGVALGYTLTPPQAEFPPLPDHPYRSLREYGPEDRALFAGRDDDVLRFAQLLDDPGTRVVVLHGESGVGKSSFLRAGVLPYLEDDCIGYRFARDRSREEGGPVLFVRATNDPVTQISAAVAAFCARPLTYTTPLGTEATVDLPTVIVAAANGRSGPEGLRDALRADPGGLSQVLAAMAAVLPFTPVLVVDQAEEVFTLARTPEDEVNRTHALEMLRRAAAGPGGFKVIVSLRTEYHGRLTDRLRKGVRAAGGVKDYLLTDFGFDDLVEAIRRPTLTTRIRYSAEVPAEKYRFRYAPGVPEEIARRVRAFTTNRQDSVLPLVQVVCTQLYELVRGRPDAVVGAEDLREIGGVEGGMDKHVGALILYLLPRLGDQEAFRRLLTHLCLSQPDGTLTTALVPADGLARLWRGRMPFGQLLEKAAGGEWRLLRVSSLQIGGDATERRYVSLGHDALAKVVVGWAEQRGRRARLLVPVLALTAFVCVLLVVGVSAIAVREVYRATTADVQRDIHGNLTRTAWYGKAAVERTLQEHVSFVEQHAAAVPDHIRTRLTLAAERAAADGPDAIPHRSTFDGWAADVMTDAKRRWPASYGRAVAVVLVAGDTPAGGLARGYTLTRAGGATAPVAERAAQPANYRTDWSFRDYFNGAGNDFKRKDRPHPVVRRTNVSHPYQSEQDGSWRLDVVTPVWSADRRVVALLSVSLHVDEHLRKPIDMPDSELREGQEVAKALGAYVVNDRGCWAWHEYGMEHLANDAKAGNFRDPDDLTALARAEAARRGMRPDDLVPWASADAGMRSDEDRYTDPVALAAGKDAPTMLAQTLLFHPYAHSTYPMLKDRAWGFVVQVPEEVAFAPVEEMKTNLVWAGSAVLFGLTAIIGPFVLAFRRIRQR